MLQPFLWPLSFPAVPNNSSPLGPVWTYSYFGTNYNEAGGFVAVLAGNFIPGSHNNVDTKWIGNQPAFSVIDQGGGVVAIQQVGLGLYLNSLSPTNDLYLYANFSGLIDSNSIGDAQLFQVVNVGGGNIALQVKGSDPPVFLTGVPNGWINQQYGQGLGSLQFQLVDQPGPAQTIYVGTNQLPILQLTGDGHGLDLNSFDLGALSLAGIDCSGTSFVKANLSAVTDLTGANFTGAHFAGANLTGHSLSGATWTNADFTGSDPSITTDLSVCAASPQSALGGAILQNVNLSGLDLSGSNLAGANLAGANLSNADLSGADLTGAVLDGATLSGTNLTNATMTGTSFKNCDLTTASFSPSPTFSHGATGSTAFTGATVPATVLGLDWSYWDLTGTTITELPDVLDGLVADYALLPSGLSFAGISLKSSSWVSTQMYEIDLAKANLESATMTGARLKGAKLSGANLSLANLAGAYLIAEEAVGTNDPNRLEAAVADGTFMIDTILAGAYCDGVDFTGALFVTSTDWSATQTATASGAYLNLASFAGAYLVGADLSDTQCSGANFYQACMINAGFQNAQLTPYSGGVAAPASFAQANMVGANCSGALMDGLDMTGAQVTADSSTYLVSLKDYYSEPLILTGTYGQTVLGNTTGSTTCPDGSLGPCSLNLNLRR